MGHLPSMSLQMSSSTEMFVLINSVGIRHAAGSISQYVIMKADISKYYF